MNYMNDIFRVFDSNQSITSLLLIDKNYNILKFNKRLQNLAGDIEVNIGNSFYTLLDVYGEKVKAGIENSFKGMSVEIEHKSLKDERYFDSIIRPLINENNEIYGSYIVSKDITERVNHLMSLEHNEKELRALYENAPLGYQSLDKNGYFLYVNDALSDMLGYTKEELLGEWFGDFLYTDGSKTFKQNFPKFKQAGETKVNIEMLTKSGEVITIMFDGKIAYKDDGTFKQTHCILKDVTEEYKKQAKIAYLSDEIHKTNALLRASLESFQDILIWSIDTNYKYLYFNESFKKSMKFLYNHDVKIGSDFFDSITKAKDKTQAKLNHNLALSGKSHTIIAEYGTENMLYFESSFNPIISEGEIIGASGFSRNITEKLNRENDLRKEKELAQKYSSELELSINIFRNSIANAPVPIMIHAEDGEVLNISNMWTTLTNYTKNDIPTIFDWTEKAYGKNKQEVLDFIKRMYELTHIHHDGEFVVTTKAGKKLTWDFHSGYIGKLPDGRSVAMSVATDVTERNIKEQEIKYLSYHDQLTGLYNRRYFEEELRRLDNPRNLPMSIIMGDVNGLKLINDAFGHQIGDNLLEQIGEIISSSIRGNDIAARWGGDEFVILMPNSGEDASNVLIKRIQEKVNKARLEYSKLSISFGTETKNKKEEDIRKLFSSAEVLMYQNKYDEIDSVRGETINTIMNTLFEKSAEVREHSERVSDIAVSIAKALKLSKAMVNDIKTMGMIHDIGKIVIDLSILDKPAKLTDEEINIIQKHPLAGSRILNSSNEYSRLVSGVLNHHERIDGKGYPNGVKGDQIPLESKIISIADAYDAMTAIRSYRLIPLTQAEAIKELKKHSGTQFDKELVDIFVDKVLLKE